MSFLSYIAQASLCETMVTVSLCLNSCLQNQTQMKRYMNVFPSPAGILRSVVWLSLDKRPTMVRVAIAIE